MKISANIIIICLSLLYGVSAEGVCWLSIETYVPEHPSFSLATTDGKRIVLRDLTIMEGEIHYDDTYQKLECSDVEVPLPQQSTHPSREEITGTKLIQAQWEYIIPGGESDSFPDLHCIGADEASWLAVERYLSEDIFLDPASIIRVDNIVRACRKIIKEEVISESFIELDCTDMSLHSLQDVTYSYNDTVREYNTVPAQWEIVTGVVNESLFRYLCIANINIG